MEREKIECCSENKVHPDLLKIVHDTMPEETELYDLAELFKVFGDSTRIRILFVLFEAEVCVCDLAAVLSMTQSAISHHCAGTGTYRRRYYVKIIRHDRDFQKEVPVFGYLNICLNFFKDSYFSLFYCYN